MSLYPSLEDMKVDQMMKAQMKDGHGHGGAQGRQQPLPYPLHQPIPSAPPVYPVLNDYMGLDLSPETIAKNMPDYSTALSVPQPQELQPVVTNMNVVAPISGGTVGLKRAQVTHGIRELILCKDKDGKVGLRMVSINSGVFVCLVVKGSPAELGGVRFGDQVLQINGNVVAGYSMDQVHKLFKKSDVNDISVVIRDRPFERTVTLMKDSSGTVGFQFKKGQIVSLVMDSSATRNGLLTEHHLLEVDGINVVGLKDKEISAIIDKAPSPLTITVIPTFIYDHIISKMSSNLIKNLMSHNVPDV